MTETTLENRALGYARVSSYGQTLDAQLEQLKAAGCVKIYREKATGAQVERRELQRMLKAMAPGDVVTVTESTGWPVRPSTCSPSSSGSWTQAGSSGHSRSRGPTVRPAPGG